MAKADAIDNEMVHRCGSIWRFDHSFKVAKNAQVVDELGERSAPFVGLLSIANEVGHIMAFGLCGTKSSEEAKPLLEGLVRRHHLHGRPLPNFIWSDNCCADSQWVQSVVPGVTVRTLHTLAMRVLIPLPAYRSNRTFSMSCKDTLVRLLASVIPTFKLLWPTSVAV